MLRLLSTLGCFFVLTAGLLKAQNLPKPPDQVLPHSMGTQFTPHHMLTSYFDYLATNSPRTVRLEQYGTTHEGRPLRVAFISSPENIQRLESIRLNQLRMAGLGDGQAPNKDNAPAIVWIGMSIHGNEPSGSECSMTLAWQLATQTDAEVRTWLQNTVVILDPSSNPDGYDRYTHWYRGVSPVTPVPHRMSREHMEPWPTGRPNHYLHDLNRDWAWATQPESRQRLALYHKWLPHVHADLHEQYFDSPYYFAPAAEPSHPYLSDFQRSFQVEIGQNHARYFNAQGWLYFTKEVFDLFYPSYGDTYPLFNGAIGMTYEQAGHSRSGRAILLDNGDTLKLSDRAQHHLTSSRSTIEFASKNAVRLNDNFREYYTRSATNPPGKYTTFCIRATNNPNSVKALCQLLDRHQIKYGRAGTGTTVRGYDYRSMQEQSNIAIDANDLIISALQPHGVLTQVLLEPSQPINDSLTYDITAWSLIHAYGLDAVATQQRIEPKQAYEPYRAPEAMLAATPYAWCFERGSMAELQCIAELCQKGVRVRYGKEGFTMSDKVFAAGSIVVSRADNRQLEGSLDGIVRDAAARANVQLYPIMSGFSQKGPDIGSTKFTLITPPSIAVVYGDEVDANSYGHTWYYFEQELRYPVVMLPLSQLDANVLADFNVLVMPNGEYPMTDALSESLSAFTLRGGRIVAFEGGAAAFAGREGYDLKVKTATKRDNPNQKPFISAERAAISDQLPGAVVRAELDPTHPLAYGLGTTYFSLKTTSNAYDMPSNGGSAAVWLGDSYAHVGFIGSRVQPRLKNSPIAVLQSVGRGSVVYFVDNPLFRSFWQQGKVLFGNALFM
jgi:Zinc carboxypeptidase